MRKLIIIGVLAISLSGYAYYEFMGKKCIGSKNCSACKNCKYCKHCAKNGGGCGVCN